MKLLALTGLAPAFWAAAALAAAPNPPPVTRDAHGRIVTHAKPAVHHQAASRLATVSPAASHAHHHPRLAGRLSPRTLARAPAPAAPPPAPVAAAAPVIDPAKGSATGLPLPRFAALRSDQVSFRAGPGTRYPIDWIYQRRDLPVKIEREFEVWRLVSEPDGTRGWVHQAMLTGRRGFVVIGDQPQTLRAAATDTADPVAILKPGVVGHLLNCTKNADWCSAEVKTYRGYLNRAAFWGTLPGEPVGQ